MGRLLIFVVALWLLNATHVEACPVGPDLGFFEFGDVRRNEAQTFPNFIAENSFVFKIQVHDDGSSTRYQVNNVSNCITKRVSWWASVVLVFSPNLQKSSGAKILRGNSGVLGNYFIAKDSKPDTTSNFECGRIAGIDYPDVYQRSIWWVAGDAQAKILGVDPKISPSLGLTNTHSRVGSSFCGFSGSFCLINHIFSIICGPARVVEGSKDCREGDCGENKRPAGRPKHPLGPSSHILLRGQIAAFSLLLCITFGLALLSYKIADRAFDACERGRIILGARRFTVALICGPVAVIGLPGWGYWLIFEGGFGSVLGLP